MPDARAFITENLDLLPARGVPEIRLYRAHPKSGLSRLTGHEAPPYWAYNWAGGTVLARYLLDHPDTVKGRRVLDLGTGSGIVAIAAAMRGAAQVIANDSDPHALAAMTLNAEANSVAIDAIQGDLTPGPLPDVDLILVGDLFYDRDVAWRVTAYLDHCVAAGIEVLVGDMGRKYLPLDRLSLRANYDVPDFGHAGLLEAKVFKYKGQGASPLEPELR